MGSFLANIIQSLRGVGAFRVKSADQLTVDDSEAGEHKLKRELGPMDAIAMGVGCIIGAGIFVMPGVVAAKTAGPGIVLSFAFSAIPCIFVAYCLMELASMIDKGGSAYTYTAATMGELVAWIIGFDLLLEYAIGGSAVAAGWSEYLQKLLSGLNFDINWLGLHLHGVYLPTYMQHAPGSDTLPWKYVLSGVGGCLFGALGWFNFGSPFRVSGANAFALLGKLATVALYGVGAWGAYETAMHLTSVNLPAIVIIILLSLLLMVGVKQTARANLFFVFVKVAVIVVFVALGIWHVQSANFDPFLPYGMDGVFRGGVQAFFAYIGFDAVSTLPEDCKNPKRDVPIGIGGSLVVSTILYMTVALVMVGVVTYTSLNTAAPMAVVLEQLKATWALPLIVVGAIAGLTSVLIVLLLGPSRILMTMSRDGLMPPVFSKMHPRLKTPVGSIALLALMVGLPAGLIPISELVDLTSIGTLFAFMLICAGVIVLRRTAPEAKRGFKVPFGNSTAGISLFGTRVIAADTFPLLGIASTMVLMAYVELLTWERFVIWLLIGFAIYFAYSRFHSKFAGSGSSGK
jgi:basic amino acid/polyamine antiporter, APA family